MASWEASSFSTLLRVKEHLRCLVQVININLLYPNPFPADQTVAIINQTAQLIHVADQLPVTPNEVCIGAC